MIIDIFITYENAKYVLDFKGKRGVKKMNMLTSFSFLTYFREFRLSRM